ncbi:MAG: Zn-dependent hydrolase [SAR324 cluster bacterium]|nr:Zn-dependent hydrolase [SAR324 cluster bacterium]
MLQIRQQRFLDNLSRQSQFGRLPKSEGGGIDRRAFSTEERAVRQYFCQQAEKASLGIAIDAAANLSARYPSADPDARTLLLGSHLDSVPNGGSYDGALGVWAALEVLSTLAESKIDLPVHLEAVAFTDEEGRLGDLFGSRALTGGHTTETIEAFLKQAAEFPDDFEAMRRTVPGALTPEAIRTARRSPQSLAGFLELHIEQGPQLEKAGCQIGVVDSIFGRRSLQVQFFGRSDHAGTTPLHLRADALVAAAHFITMAPEILQQQFPNCVLTCGNVLVRHGAYNVVPAETAVWVEFRASSEDVLQQIEKALDRLAGNITAAPDLSFAIHPKDQLTPAAMDDSVQGQIRQVAQELGYPAMTLSSGALHDAKLMASITPTGMIFVPSKEGRSHSPAEDTESEDLVAGANVLLHTVLRLCSRSKA